MGKHLSSVYLRPSLAYNTRSTHIFQRWHSDMPELLEEDCIFTYVTSMILDKDWFIKPKFLHRVHNTPQCLASIYPQVDSPEYEVCCIHWYISEHGMVLSCAVLTPFCESVTQTPSQLYDIPLRPEPLFLLLGHMEDVVADRYTKLLI